MMFEMSFNLYEEGALIRKVVDQSLAEGVVTEDLFQWWKKPIKPQKLAIILPIYYQGLNQAKYLLVLTTARWSGFLW